MEPILVAVGALGLDDGLVVFVVAIRAVDLAHLPGHGSEQFLALFVRRPQRLEPLLQSDLVRISQSDLLLLAVPYRVHP